MTTPADPAAGSAAGPATRAVLEEYHRGLAAYRRTTRVGHAVTAVLAVGLVVTLSAGTLGFLGFRPPWFITVSPIPVLVAWLMWKRDIMRLLGAAGEPAFPERMLEIAATTDDVRANPRPFGSVPSTMRQYRPENG